MTATKAWSGHVDMNKAALQVAGLNQPLQLNKARLDWKDGQRSASMTDVEGSVLLGRATGAGRHRCGW